MQEGKDGKGKRLELAAGDHVIVLSKVCSKGAEMSNPPFLQGEKEPAL